MALGCRRISYAASGPARVIPGLFRLARRVRAALYLTEVLSAVGKSLGTGMVTDPVAAHSVPR